MNIIGKGLFRLLWQHSTCLFYKNFCYNPSNSEVEHDLVKEAVDIINQDTLNGKITFGNDSDDIKLAYQVFTVEMTYEHLCISFMEYIRMLDDLVERTMKEYINQIRERQVQNHSASLKNEQGQSRTILVNSISAYPIQLL